jgi:hypothetical protein
MYRVQKIKSEKNLFFGLLNLGLSRTYKWKKNFVVRHAKMHGKDTSLSCVFGKMHEKGTSPPLAC